MWEKGKNVRSRVIEHCVIKGNSPVYLFGKEHIVCVQGRTLLSAFPHTNSLLLHKHKGRCPHLRPPLCFQPSTSIQLGAVRMGCRGCLGSAHCWPSSCCVPWLSPRAALLPLPSPQLLALGKTQILGLMWGKAPWAGTGTAALLSLQH